MSYPRLCPLPQGHVHSTATPVVYNHVDWTPSKGYRPFYYEGRGLGITLLSGEPDRVRQGEMLSRTDWLPYRTICRHAKMSLELFDKE